MKGLPAISSRRGIASKRSIRGRVVAFFQVAAVDLDGTLTSGGQVSAQAVDAVDRVRRNGLVVVLVTGRIGAELQLEFSQIAGHVDALVLENGAVTVIDGTTRALAAPVDEALDDALAAIRQPQGRNRAQPRSAPGHAPRACRFPTAAASTPTSGRHGTRPTTRTDRTAAPRCQPRHRPATTGR